MTTGQGRLSERYALLEKAVFAPAKGIPHQCITSGGQPKRKYFTREEAKRVAKGHDNKVRAYRCSVCGYFHVGRTPTGAKA